VVNRAQASISARIRRSWQAKRLVILLLIGLGLGATGVLAKTIVHAIGEGPDRHSDFITYYTAAKLLQSGLSPYDLQQQRSVRAALPGCPAADPNAVLWYFLPPPFLLAIVPFLRLSPRAANVLWSCIQALVVWPACLLLLRRQLSASVWWLTLAWAALWFPMVAAMKFGQLSLILLLAFLGLRRSLAAGRDITAALCLAMLTVKPPLIVLPLLLFVWQRRWKALLASGAFIVAAYALTLALYRPALLSEYLSSLSVASMIQASNESWRQSTYSLAAITGRLGPGQLPLLVAATLGVVVLWGGILWRWGPIEAALGMPAASVLISPHALTYDLVLCLTSLPLLAERSAYIAIALTTVGFLLPWATRLPWFPHMAEAEPPLMAGWVLSLLITVLSLRPHHPLEARGNAAHV
jgi:hypothetical protein